MYFCSLGSIEYPIYIFLLLSVYPITDIKFIRVLLFSSVNHTSINKNSVLIVFSIINECGEILINWSNCLCVAVNDTFDASCYSALILLQLIRILVHFRWFYPSQYLVPCCLIISLFILIIILAYSLSLFLKLYDFFFRLISIDRLSAIASYFSIIYPK